jgi:hypothetical protein
VNLIACAGKRNGKTWRASGGQDKEVDDEFVLHSEDDEEEGEADGGVADDGRKVDGDDAAADDDADDRTPVESADENGKEDEDAEEDAE